MSVENAKQFLDHLRTDETLQKSLGEAQLANLVKIAGESGFDVSPDDLKQVISSTEPAEGEISDEQADKASGGFLTKPKWMQGL